jgi:hypothetical protein
MPSQYEHLQWSRVDSVQSRHRQSGYSQDKTPFREDAPQHGEDLEEKSQRSLGEEREQRERLGIDPSQLLILEFTFIGADLRSRLEQKFRVRIVEERAEEDEYDNPFYEVHLTFDDEQEQARFREREDLDALEITGFRPARQSDGQAAPDELYVQFPDIESAKDFRVWLEEESEVQASARKQKKESRVDNQRMLVQFPDAASIDSFERELGLYQETAAHQREADDTTLTYIQRQGLFDALDDITRVTEEDRRGARLRSESVPDGEFCFDVDLWHPGADQLQKLKDQFKEIVEEAGGTITDQREVVDSLFLARVKGDSDTLETALRYDQAARVDLPPVFEEPDFEEPEFDFVRRYRCTRRAGRSRAGSPAGVRGGFRYHRRAPTDQRTGRRRQGFRFRRSGSVRQCRPRYARRWNCGLWRRTSVRDR